MSFVFAASLGFTLSIILYTTLTQAFAGRIRIERRIDEITLTDRKAKSIEDEELVGSFYERLLKPFIQNLGNRLSQLTPVKLRLNELERLYAAGQPRGITIYEWLSWRVIAAVLGLMLGLYFFFLIKIVLLKVIALVIGTLLGFYAPVLYLSNLIKKRQHQILKGLPDAIDLLNVSVEAGLGFDAAMWKVEEKLKGVIGEEFHKTLQEMKMGKPRREALRNLSKRNQLDELQSFVGAIIQADQLGVPLGNVLRIQSEDIRMRRKQLAEEKAMKAPIKILFPLIFFIFPSLFVTILGPALINIVNTLLSD